jgi:hypothetical protein
MPPGHENPRPLMYGYVVPTRPLPPPAPTNGLGIAGFVTALVGLVLFWVPLLGVVLAGTGLVLSAVGMSQGKRNGSSTGLAVAGLVLGILGVLAFVVILAGLVSAGSS